MSKPVATAVVIPVRTFEGAKSRLGAVLDAEERRDLVERLLKRTIAAALATPGVAEVVVVSPDPGVLEVAVTAGARPLLQRSRGLNPALHEGRAAIRSDRLLVLPADLPGVTADALAAILAAGDAAGAPAVVLAPDRHGRGTNALLLAPPDVIDPAFGGDSRADHAWLASSADAVFVEVPGELALDIDTPDDLLLAETQRPEALLPAEDPRATRDATPGDMSSDATPDTRPGDIAPDSGTDGHVEILALARLPEIRPGDDLGALIGDALAATPGVLPLQPGDVLVVTQKIVSKAEGAIVDLRTVTPRPEAAAWAAAWDRDPRQIEVVIQQARRIVRMAYGVLIVETEHGFVCANAGVDASNVGPDSGNLVTLLPRDPDASATRIRATVRARFGHDLPVIVSDSFGRPWRWGITDVALGVSGIRPLEDLRGLPDADGRVMRTTVRAVADELASAAELALGKTAGRPVALVRGTNPPLGEGSIRDQLIAPEHDLFR